MTLHYKYLKLKLKLCLRYCNLDLIIKIMKLIRGVVNNIILCCIVYTLYCNDEFNEEGKKLRFRQLFNYCSSI